ncbi:MAG: Gfo/Idh/MocA family oxidoreductase, partial [Verrucomicrobia bacterium]|nr:Gfo/Idh/MocA family oxidoreductase [Verrucomicrobiota bacterium]MBU1734685.1 Gfo/Idh/MocA family oxidoreductase [Verrucomicrobiota bacterium]
MKMNEIGKSAQEALAYVKAIPPAQGKTMMNVPFEKRDLVRFGFIGVGGRGSSQLNEVLAVEGARCTAISDPVEEKMLKAKEKVEQAGQPAPALEKDWQSLCERSDVDLVYICSPWDLHAPQAVRAMECGKHVAVEVPCANTLADCWHLVDVSERTRRHCIILENCCYGSPELTVLNLIRQGCLGTITHGEAAYIHDLRSVLLAPHGEGLWRRNPHRTRNGNLYPTHGLGPVAWYMDIHHGDRFARLVSMSSLSAALAEYRDANLPADDPKRREKYNCGDMNTSLIQTANGRTIMLQHDVVTPRPYSRLNLVQGSKGTFSDYPPRIFFDGQGTHEWASYDAIKAEYEHPLWKEHGEQALKLGGHGGMDYIMNYRLVQTYRQGLPPDLNVYDAAAWSAPGPLSDISVAWDSLALPFPDFTRGNWRQTGSAPL